MPRAGAGWCLAPNWVPMLEQKTIRTGIFFRARQWAALSLFRVGKSQVLQNRVGFPDRNEKSLVVQGSQNKQGSEKGGQKGQFLRQHCANGFHRISERTTTLCLGSFDRSFVPTPVSSWGPSTPWGIMVRWRYIFIICRWMLCIFMHIVRKSC